MSKMMIYLCASVCAWIILHVFKGQNGHFWQSHASHFWSCLVPLKSTEVCWKGLIDAVEVRETGLVANEQEPGQEVEQVQVQRVSMVNIIAVIVLFLTSAIDSNPCW